MSLSKTYAAITALFALLSNVVRVGGGLGIAIIWLFGPDRVANLSPYLRWVSIPANITWTTVILVWVVSTWTAGGLAWFFAKGGFKRSPKPKKMATVDLVVLVLLAHGTEHGSLDGASDALRMLQHAKQSSGDPKFANSAMCADYSQVQIKASFARLSAWGLIDYMMSYYLSPKGLAYFDKHSDSIAELVGLA